MSEARSYFDYLEDIRDNLTKVVKFVEGMSFSEFESDERTQYAVIRALEVVGEASKQIPDRVRRRYVDVPWRQMAGMRDRLIHGYLHISLEVVWDAAQKEAPRILPHINTVIDRER